MGRAHARPAVVVGTLEEWGMASRAEVREMAERAPGPSITGATLDPPAWRGRLAGPFSSVRLAAIGLRRTWPLLAIVSLGMLAAITLVCTVPLYSNLVSGLQIQQTITSTPPLQKNIEVRAQVNDIHRAHPDATDARIGGIAAGVLGDLAPGSRAYAVTQQPLQLAGINGVNPFAPSGNPPHTLLDLGARAVAYGFDLGQAAPHMRISAGRLPQDVAAGQPPEALVVDRMPNVKVGDTITLRASSDQAVIVRVAGAWYPKDEQDPYWEGQVFDPAKLGVAVGGVNDAPPVYPILLARPTFFAALDLPPQQASDRPISVDLHYIYFTSPEAVTTDNLAARIAAVKGFRTAANGNLPGFDGVFGVTTLTTLDAVLAQLQQDLSLLSLPLYVVVAQIVGLALFFVVAMAGLLIDGQANEIATLKSRGVSGAQVLLGYALVGALLAALCAALAPTLGAALAMALVRAFVPSTAQLAATPIGQRYLAQAASPATLLLPTLAMAALAAGALVVAALRAARLDVLALRRERGREAQVPFWKRYYLDILLAVLCAAGYLELGDFGGLSVRRALGAEGAGPDPFLLAAPGLLLLAGALLALRLFPLGARAGMWLAARGRGAVGMLAFGQVARAAEAFGRLALLLTLAVGLGFFALDFRASLARNAVDHAAYTTGGDELVHMQALYIDSATLQAQYARLPGVRGITPIYRSSASTVDGAFEDVSMLGVDPATLAGVAYWRDDYAGKSLSSLMGALGDHARDKAMGDPDHPIWAVVSAGFAADQHLRIGDRFALAPSESPTRLIFVAGAVVNDFPTLYTSSFAGFVIVNLPQYTAALDASHFATSFQANEFWLRTTADPRVAAARVQAMNSVPSVAVAAVTSRRALLQRLQANPLDAGMVGLLLVGAIAAAALGVVASLVQAALSARTRLRQFAILRTLGISAGQLTRMLLGEQLAVYGFGLLGGAALGVLLSSATLPFLQFGDSLAGGGQAGVPPYVLVFDGAGVALFASALVVAFALALALTALIAARIGLGRALRLGED